VKFRHDDFTGAIPIERMFSLQQLCKKNNRLMMNLIGPKHEKTARELSCLKLL